MSQEKASLLPQDILLWFGSFTWHVVRSCRQPSSYQIRLEVPSAEDQPSEVSIWQVRRLNPALLDNAIRSRIQHEKLRVMD